MPEQNPALDLDRLQALAEATTEGEWVAEPMEDDEGDEAWLIVQWEYGDKYGPADHQVEKYRTEEAAREYGGAQLVRRRVFPWEPVPDTEEPKTEATS